VVGMGDSTHDVIRGCLFGGNAVVRYVEAVGIWFFASEENILLYDMLSKSMRYPLY
jgi:hypothetical protein